MERINDLLNKELQIAETIGKIEYGKGFESQVYPILKFFPDELFDNWLIGPGKGKDIDSVAFVNETFEGMYDPNKITAYCYGTNGESLGKMEFKDWKVFNTAIQFLPKEVLK